MSVQNNSAVRKATAASGTVLLWLCANNAVAQETETADAHHDIDEIVVKAAPLDRTTAQLAQPTAVLSGDSLETKQSASIGETVSGELGVSSSYFGPVASRPVIRGQFGERVRVLANALDSLDASALSEDHAVSVDGILADRIEIVRGPATLLYGSGAAGGIVNVVDDRIAEQPLDSPFGGAVTFGTDSATGRRSAAAKIDFGSDDIAVHLDYFRRDTDDVQIPGFAESALLRALEEEEGTEEAFGVVENTDSRTEGAAAAITFTGERGFLGVSLSSHQSDYGVPGHHEEDPAPLPLPAPAEEFVRIDLDQSRVDARGEFDFEGPISKLVFRSAWNDYTHMELEGDEVGTIFDTIGSDIRLELRHAPLGGFEGAFGLQHKKTKFDAIGDEAFVPPSDTVQSSLFLFEEWAVNDDLAFQASGRAERQKIDAPSLPKYTGIAGGASLGAIWAVSDSFRIRANLAFTQRHPNSTELYADGPHVAVDRYERGSVAQGAGLLTKEKSTNLDLTFHGDTQIMEYEATLFVNSVDDYILLSPTAEIQDDFQVFEYGQSDVKLYGVEAEARIELLDAGAGHVHTRLFGDMVRGEERGNGDNLPRIPPLRLGIGLHYAIDRVEAGMGVTWHDEQTRTAANELPTESYLLLSAELSYSFDQPNIFVFARGTNLTDEDARQHTSPLKDTFPLPGRSLQLGIRYDF